MPNTTFPCYIAPSDLYFFGQGRHWDIYRILGAHPAEQDGRTGYRFAVWAPHAQEVFLCGSFNDWRWGEYSLYPVGVSGIWSAFAPGLFKGLLYKFGIRQEDGRIVYKADPYAFFAEMRPGTAAITWDLDNYIWQDTVWMEARCALGPPLARPISIYEVHLGSWRRKLREQPGFLTWDELADKLIPYAIDLGFTHLQLMPVAEHSLDESWGYQTSYYYAPTSRFGMPEGFKAFVDRCHGVSLGVLLDWVPGHFPKDDWCLGRFDGSALYEHSDPRLGEHPDWGTYIFNYGRHEVRNFLFANALYWLKEFHLDGLRIDAVASILYRDYSRQDGAWIPNIYGGKENLEAIDFLKELNRVVQVQHPGVIMVAEESTTWPGVSKPLHTGGLGFTFKWNMGWMHDTLEYFSKEPLHRSWYHKNLTFSVFYAFTENFVLPLSHDEVVYGKGALLSKMPGDIWQQQANLRALLAYQWAYPGKKLLFMGAEFGQWKEWSDGEELDWMLLDYPAHQGIFDLVRDLNGLMVREPAMHVYDYDWTGFEWVDFTDHNASVISFLRKCREERQVLWVFNFTPVVRKGYCIACPRLGFWQELLNTDAACYGGSNVGNYGRIIARAADGGRWSAYLELDLPPLAALALQPDCL